MSALSELCQQMRGCQRCELAKGRTNVVPGEGSENPRFVLIGEAPGFHEDRQGRPFVGAAGQFLNELLKSIGLTRQDVYICNVIKCRPPSNRDPLPDEIAACKPWLDGQLAELRPRLIVTLGRFSMGRYLPGAIISRVHGQPKRLPDGTVVMPMFHPAAALHQPKYRQLIEEDFQKIPALLEKLQAAEQAETPPAASEPSDAQPGTEKPSTEPKQLSLF